MTSFASVNTSLLLSCQTGLLKLACDYYYPPCHPMMFQQIPICGDSCESVALIQTSCPSKVEDMELNVPSEVLDLDCSSSLVEGVTVSQDQCIDLSSFGKLANCLDRDAESCMQLITRTAMNLIPQTQPGKQIIGHIFLN